MQDNPTGTSDYRGPQINTSSSSSKVLKPYSEAAKKKPTISFPKKEQGIVLGIVDGLTFEDYVTTVGKIVGPKNIISASRISNNRFCMFLTSIQLVESIATNHSTVNINGHTVNIRKLITPAKRIVLSNVTTYIPNEPLEDAIRDIGFKMVSPITVLRAGLHGEEYAHIQSFRRQVYVQPDESIDLPSSVLIKCYDTEHRIFLNDDTLICFLCKKPGHIANYCPQRFSTTQPLTDTDTENDINLENTQTESNPETRIPEGIQNTTVTGNEGNTQKATDMSTLVEPIPLSLENPNKRPAPSTTCSSPTESEPPTATDSEPAITLPSPTSKFKTPYKANKKMKISETIEQQLSVKEMLEPARVYFENKQPKSSITFEKITDFLENVQGSPDPLSVAYLYTSNIPHLLELLTEIRPLLNHRSIKNRITRIKNKINKKLNNVEAVETESNCSETDDSSQQSSY